MRAISQQAHLLTINENYQKWAQSQRLAFMSSEGHRYQGVVLTPQRLANEFLKWCCGIESKKEIESCDVARSAFVLHHRQYTRWCVRHGLATAGA